MTDPATAPPSSCIAGSRRRPHPATDGLLCRHHFEEVGKWLGEIVDEAARLSTAPRLETSYNSAGSASLTAHRSPAVLEAVVLRDDRSAVRYPNFGPVCAYCPAALTHRCTCPPGPSSRRVVHWEGCPRVWVHPSCGAILDDRDEGTAALMPILATLHGWAQKVRDERRLEPPAGTVVVPLGVFGEWARTMTVAPTVMSEKRVLIRQLSWIAAQPWVVRFRAEVGDLRALLLRLNRNEDPDPLPGYCYRLVDGEECRGDLWPAEPLHTTGYESREGYRAVACARHPKEHRWEGDDLPRLLVIIDDQKSRTEEAS